MADQKISAMPSAATLDGTEITPIVQTGTNKQVTTANYVSQVLNVNAVTATQGGTNIKTYTLGDTLYASGTNTLAKLAGNTTTTTLVVGNHGWKLCKQKHRLLQVGGWAWVFGRGVLGSHHANGGANHVHWVAGQRQFVDDALDAWAEFAVCAFHFVEAG